MLEIGDLRLEFHTNLEKMKQYKRGRIDKQSKHTEQQIRAAVKQRWMQGGADVRWCPPEGNHLAGDENRLVDAVWTILNRKLTPAETTGQSLVTSKTQLLGMMAKAHAMLVNIQAGLLHAEAESTTYGPFQSEDEAKAHPLHNHGA